MIFAPLEGLAPRSKVTIATPPWLSLTFENLQTALRERQPSFWSRTSSTSTARRHSTKPFPAAQPALSAASNGNYTQSTVVARSGESNSASYRPSASTRLHSRQTTPSARKSNAWQHDRNCPATQRPLALFTNPKCTYQTQSPLTLQSD